MIDVTESQRRSTINGSRNSPQTVHSNSACVLSRWPELVDITTNLIGCNHDHKSARLCTYYKNMLSPNLSMQEI